MWVQGLNQGKGLLNAFVHAKTSTKVAAGTGASLELLVASIAVNAIAGATTWAAGGAVTVAAGPAALALAGVLLVGGWCWIATERRDLNSPARSAVEITVCHGWPASNRLASLTITASARQSPGLRFWTLDLRAHRSRLLSSTTSTSSTSVRMLLGVINSTPRESRLTQGKPCPDVLGQIV